MNGRTATLINNYARLSGQGESRRAMKRAWNGFTSAEKTKARIELRSDVEKLREAQKFQADIQKNRSVRRYLAGDGTRVIWLLGDDGNNLTFIRRGDEIQQPTGVQTEITTQGFDKFWAFACPDAIPAPDLEPLNLPPPKDETPAIVAAPAQQETM